MRFSLATATAAALPFLLTLTTTAAEPQKVVEASSIPSEETMVISTPLVIARQEANLAPALPPPSSPPSAGLRGTNSPTEVEKASTAAVEAVSVIQDKWEKKEFWNVFYSNGDGDRNQIR